MHDDDSHDLGLAHDLRQLQRGLSRRGLALGALAGWGAMSGLGGLALAALAPGRAGAQAGSCAATPSEMAGPFPANGTARFGGPAVNALALAGIVRSDIRSSVAGASATAAGVPLRLKLELADSGAACAGLAGLAVYVWQCDREGRYSMYSPALRDENYLRGVQVSDAKGQVEFDTVFPGCYPGRMPHLHFEVYRSLATAGAAGARLKTTQMALPRELCEQVYAKAPGYEPSVQPLGRISFASDMVFRDGVPLQMPSLRGSIEQGFTATWTLAITA